MHLVHAAHAFQIISILSDIFRPSSAKIQRAKETIAGIG